MKAVKIPHLSTLGGIGMSTKEYAMYVLDSLSEEELLDFLRFYADDNTLARAESEMIANNPHRKRYNSFEEIIEEIENEDLPNE